jgi:hypothetical protein
VCWIELKTEALEVNLAKFLEQQMRIPTIRADGPAGELAALLACTTESLCDGATATSLRTIKDVISNRRFQQAGEHIDRLLDSFGFADTTEEEEYAFTSSKIPSTAFNEGLTGECLACSLSLSLFSHSRFCLIRLWVTIATAFINKCEQRANAHKKHFTPKQRTVLASIFVNQALMHFEEVQQADEKALNDALDRGV